jgi:hypothetical protein
MANYFRRSPGRLCRECLINWRGNAQLVADDFFENEGSPPTYFGILKRWGGAAWVLGELKVYASGSWQLKPCKRWDGSAWKTINTSGV